MEENAGEARTVSESVDPPLGVDEAQWLSLFLAKASLGTWCWDLQSDKQTLSSELLEFFDVAGLDESITLRWQDFLLEADSARVQRELEDYRSQNKRDPFTIPCRVQAGSVAVSVLVHGALLEDSAGKKLIGFFQSRESSESRQEIAALESQLSECREQQEEERQASQDQVSAIVQGMYDALITFDELGEILTWNPAAERMFGIPAEDTLGKNVRKIMPSPLDTQATKFYNDVVHDPSGTMFGAKIDVVATRGDRSKFQAELALSNYKVQGQFHYIATVRDVTLKKRAEEALRTGRREAERANIAKSQFLANMSHELHTPLNAILGFNQALTAELYGPLNDKQKKTMAIIEKSSKSLLQLLDNLLDLAKLEADRLTLNYSVGCIVAMTGAVLDSYKEQMAKKNIQGQFEANNQLPKLKVDYQRLEQVLRILIDNALKFTREGGLIKVRVQAALDEERLPFTSMLEVQTKRFKRVKRRVQITVEDNGIGISRAHQTRIFSKFHQVDASHKRQKNGAGLGLALAKSLVEAQKGEIQVESSQEGPRRGTRFTLTFPEHLE